MRVLLIDDHVLFRQGLRFLLGDLDKTLDFVELRCCEDLSDVNDREFDLVLLDFHLPGVSGVDALNYVRQLCESAPVVVLSGEESAKGIRSVIDNGAAGFIPKSSEPPVMMAALRLVVAGGVYLPRHVLEGQPLRAQVASVSAGFEEGSSVLDCLSTRQAEALQSAVKGRPNKVIARELGISEGTVKAHLSAAFRALGVKNRTEAVFAMAQAGLAAG